jgi:hypothetical protein
MENKTVGREGEVASIVFPTIHAIPSVGSIYRVIQEESALLGEMIV